MERDAHGIGGALEAHGPSSTPRHDPAAEECVLGAIIADNAALPLAAAVCSAEDFYHPARAMVFEAMVALASRREPIDYLTLCAELRALGRLNSVGGAQGIDDFLERLVRLVGTSANIENHARVVANDARVRRIEHQCQRVLSMARDHRARIEDIEDQATRGMATVAAPRDDARVVDAGQAAEEAFEKIQARLRGVTSGSVSTGYRDLDRILGGLFDQQLIILAGRPRMGKSALASGMIDRMARAELTAARAEHRTPRRGLFVSLEMPRAELGIRHISGLAGVSQSGIKDGDVSADEVALLMGAVQDVSMLPFRVVDRGKLRFAELAGIVARERLRWGGLFAVFVDYLQLVRSDGRSGSREQDVSAVARGLKELAMDCGCPVVALSQLNRECESRPNKRPGLHDLRESGEIEQAADVVAFVYRDEVYNKGTQDRGIAEVIVAKQRSGPEDTARLKWTGHLTRFDDLEDAPTAQPALPIENRGQVDEW